MSTEPTALEERVAIIAEGCGVSFEDAQQIAESQHRMPRIDHPIVMFDRCKTTHKGYRGSATIVELFDLLSNPRRYASAPMDDAGKMAKPENLGMVGFFDSDGSAKTEDCRGASLLGIDYDSGATSIVDALKLWGDRASLVAHTSFNHTADRPRFRVVLELDRIATPAEYATLYRGVLSRAETAGHAVDRSCSNITRRWFMPAALSNREYIARIVCRKPPLDVSRTVAAIESLRAAKRPPAPTYTPPLGDTKAKRGAAWLVVAADAVRGAAKGSRDAAMRDYVVAAGGYVATGWIGFNQAGRAFLDAILANGGTEEADRAKIVRLLRKGMEYPMDLPDRPR